MSKVELEKLMIKNIKKIVKQWDDDGIIFEGTFGFSSLILEQCSEDIYNIIIINDGHEASHHVTADSDSGIYAFYDAEAMKDKDAQNLISYFDINKN